MAYTPEPNEHARCVEVNGAQINVVDLGDPDATPIIFLHGGGPGCTGWNDWHPVGEQLGGRYRRIYVDLPYYGKSSATSFNGPMWTGLAEFVGGTFDALGVVRAHVVCQSFGGSAAIVLAGKRPELFLGLALTGTVLEYGIIAPYMGDRVLEQVIVPMFDGEPTRQQMRTLLEVAEWVHPEAIPDELVEARYQIAATEAAIDRYTKADLLGTPEDLGPFLRLNKVPTLLAYGDRDPFAAADIPVHLFNTFADARLVLVKDASHHFPEEIPHTYLSIIRPWFDECEACLRTTTMS